MPATFHFSRPHILRKLPLAKVVSSKNFRNHPLFMAGRGLGNRWGASSCFFFKLGGWDAKYGIWGSPNFCTENWGSCICWGITKKTIVIMMILTKEVENFLNPPICVQHSEVFRLLLGTLLHLALKFDLNQSADQMKVGSFCKPVAFNSHPNYIGSV